MASLTAPELPPHKVHALCKWHLARTAMQTPQPAALTAPKGTADKRCSLLPLTSEPWQRASPGVWSTGCAEGPAPPVECVLEEVEGSADDCAPPSTSEGSSCWGS